MKSITCWSSVLIGACCCMVIPMAHAQTNNDQALSLVTSSSFEMIISPTLEELDAGATSKLKAAMKSTLFSEALSSTALSSVFDMDIGLQQIDWNTSQDSVEVKSLGSASTKLKFIVLATFFKNNNGDFPSLYALDSHIVQTFSQPSRKSSFVSMLVSSNEPLLSQVTDISVKLVDTSSPTSAPAPLDDEQETGSKSLSSLDIILIVASTSIFFGIVYMIYQHHKDRADMDDRQARSWRNRDPRTVTTPRRRGGRQLVLEQEIGGSTSAVSKKCNIEVYGDEELFDEEAQAPSTPSTTHSPKADPEPGSPPLFRKLNFATDYIVEAMPSPPMSPFSPMPSVSSHSTQGTGSPHLLGAPMPIYTTENPPLSPSSAPSLLSPRLLSLPNMTPNDGGDFFRVSYPRSVRSAPVFSRVQSSDFSARAQIGETHPSSMASSSSESSSSASVRSCISASGRSTESVASADENSSGTDTAEFDDNWFKAKAAELEEEKDDQDNLEDAIQADTFPPMPSVSSHSTQGTDSPRLLGAPMPIYTSENPPLSPSSAPSLLSPRLLSPRLSSLPNMTPNDGGDFFRVSHPRSVKSAPVFSRVQSSDSSAWAQIGETHPSSMASSSSESSASASVRSGLSASGRSTEFVASADENSTGTDTAEFDDNWFKAKAAELEEEEKDDQDSLEDGFQADTDNNVFRDIDENRSRMSGNSGVTEWVKSIPVIQSQTSESTNSSAEHSYVEPNAAHLSEHGSVDDNSLEHSLATSCVEL